MPCFYVEKIFVMCWYSITDLNSTDFLFKPIVLHKSDNTYKFHSGSLSYTRCREILKDALESIGLDAKKFGLHSLRSGGASAAAAVGVPDRLFKRQGRWRSDSSKDRYIKETMSNKLLVSMNLINALLICTDESRVFFT